MAKTVKFENVAVTGLQLTTVTMRNTGEQRSKLSVSFNDASMQAYGAQVWGAEKIAELALKQGEQVTLHCALQGRMFGGGLIYSLHVYKVERPTAESSEEENELGL